MRAVVKAAALPLAVLVAHFYVLHGTDIYGTFLWADNITHFLGGTAIAAFFCAAVGGELGTRYIGTLNRFGWQLMVLALTALAAMGWEFLEWGSDMFFDTRTQAGLFDTMQDMLMGMLGCLPVLVYIQCAVK